MAEYVGFGIHFDAPFGPDNLRAFFMALRTAVRENWEKHRDTLSWPGPDDEDLDTDSLLAKMTPEHMKSSVADEAVLISDGWISFAFGPLSAYCGLLTVGRSREGKLFAWLSVCDHEMYRNDMDRLRHRQEYDPGFDDPRLLPDPFRDDDPQPLSDPIRDADRTDAEPFDCDRIPEIMQENDRRYALYYRDHETVWAASAACLRHIFERVSATLPIERSWMDEELLPTSARSGLEG